MQFWALIVDSLRQSRDRKIFWVLIGLTLFVVLVMASIGFYENRITFLFGLFDTQTDAYSPLSAIGKTRIASLVVYGLMSLFLGWIGVLLMIVATAGVFPTLMESGAIDVVLAKPLSRPRLFLYKYLASMVFVLIQATLFVTLTFLVMWLRWGVWAPGYLLCIPLLVLLFSYVYCVSVLVAVTTRSTVAAILVAVGAWVMFGLVHDAPGIFEVVPGLKEHQTLYRAVRAVSWIPPKTAAIPYLAAKWSGAGTSLDMFPASITANDPNFDQAQMEQARQLEQDALEVSPLASIGSSLLFETVFVLLAMWKFSRRDF